MKNKKCYLCGLCNEKCSFNECEYFECFEYFEDDKENKVWFENNKIETIGFHYKDCDHKFILIYIDLRFDRILIEKSTYQNNKYINKEQIIYNNKNCVFFKLVKNLKFESGLKEKIYNLVMKIFKFKEYH